MKFFEFEIYNRCIKSQNQHVLDIVNYLNDSIVNDLNVDFTLLYDKYKLILISDFLRLILSWLHVLHYIDIDFESKKIQISQKFLQFTKNNNFMINIFTIRMNFIFNDKYTSHDYMLLDNFDNFDDVVFFFDFLKTYYQNIRVDKKNFI
jgi:hypothetical protein